MQPEIDILEEIEADSRDEANSLLNSAEEFWIEYLRYIGFPLTNLRAGGLNGFHSEETKKKIGLKSAAVSAETREKRRQSMLGKNSGKWAPDDPRREKIRIKKIGSKASESTRMKMRAAHLARWERLRAGG